MQFAVCRFARFATPMGGASERSTFKPGLVIYLSVDPGGFEPAMLACSIFQLPHCTGKEVQNIYAKIYLTLQSQWRNGNITCF